MFVDSGAITGFRSFAFLVFFSLFLVSIRFFYHFTDYRTDVALVNVSAKISIYNQIYVEIVERVRAHTWFFMFGGSCKMLLILPNRNCLSGNGKGSKNCLLSRKEKKRNEGTNKTRPWVEVNQASKRKWMPKIEIKHRKKEFHTYYTYHININSIINRIAYNNTRDIFSIHHHANRIKIYPLF